MTNVIYYVGFAENLNQDLKRELRPKVDTFDFELNYDTLLNRICLEQTDILILDYREYAVSFKQLEIFSSNSDHYVPVVIVAGYNNLETGLNAPSNYIYLKYEEIPLSIESFKNSLEKVRYNTINNNANNIMCQELIYDTLMMLGFNSSTNGTNFIKEGVSQIILNHCQPTSFSSTIYLKVSEKYGTSVACVARCIKVALNTAWKNKDKHKIQLDSGVNFDDFVSCPTSKEFIYYLATKLYNYQQSLRFCKKSD